MDNELWEQISDYLQIEGDCLQEEWEYDLQANPTETITEDIKVWLFENLARQVQEGLLPDYMGYVKGVVKLIPTSTKKEDYLFGIKVMLNGHEFLCAIGYEESIGRPQIGLTCKGCNGFKYDDISQFAKFNFPEKDYNSNQNWYVFRLIDYDNLYEGFADFIREVMQYLPQEEKH